jgi:hypothetical protein
MREIPMTVAKHITGWTMCLVVGVVLVCWGGSSSHAQILIDDFNDGNDEGWQRVDTTTGDAWGPGTFDASSGSYQLEGASAVPTGERGELISFYEGSTDPAFTDGYLRTTLSTDNNTLVFLLMRSDAATFTGYLFGASASDGVFFWNKFKNYTFIEGDEWLPDTPFAVGQEWVLEAGTVGNQLSMKAWRLGELEPPDPQWTHIDDSSRPLTEGQFAVGASRFPPLPPETLNATFDDIFFRVPEPSMFALTFFGFVTLLSCSGRKRILSRK